ncbi:MAG: tetratricopeptide repeat protein [Pseudomonadota bacterium]
MKIRSIFLAIALLFSTNALADFNDGVVALMMGDYDKAVQILMPLAETADHAYAQYFVGRMFAGGQGVEQDYDAAAKWYRKAAEKGVGDAQYRLGSLYQKGRGVPKDMEYAYGWYSVAAHLGNAKAKDAQQVSASNLNDSEMKAAQNLSEDLIQKYGKIPKETSRIQ